MTNLVNVNYLIIFVVIEQKSNTGGGTCPIKVRSDAAGWTVDGGYSAKTATLTAARSVAG